MTTCLILAAGNAERHNGGNKPLLTVGKTGKKTLLARTIEKCEMWFGCRPFIVTHRQDVMDAAMGCTCWIPKARRWIVETLLCTSEAWPKDDRTVVLLGDVYYTKHAYAEIAIQSGLAAFGKGCDIYALCWRSISNECVASGLKQSVADAEARPASHGAGKLWKFVERNGIALIDFGDATTDFDSPQEHKRFIEKYASH